MNKIYNKFADRYGNQYSFNNYLDFSRFWFSYSRKTLLNRFEPALFAQLQKAAANSKEARTKAETI